MHGRGHGERLIGSAPGLVRGGESLSASHAELTRDRGREVICVSAGLGVRGGGLSALARLLVRAASRYCEERGLSLSVLALPGLGETPILPASPAVLPRWRLALQVLTAQLRAARPFLIFDLLGLARLQALVPKALMSPYLLYLHGIEVWEPLNWQRRCAIERASVRLTHTQYTLRRAREGHGFPFDAAVVPPGLDVEPSTATPDFEMLAAAGSGYVLIVGRMATSERYKGHDELFRAVAAVRGKGLSLRAIVVGEGDDVPRLKKLAEDLGLAAAVRFTGYVSDGTLSALYERADVVALPSRGEGFGLVYLEAMRAGKPCLALRGSAAEESVEHGETGLLVDPNRADALEEALRLLVANPDYGRRLGAVGRRRFLQRFTYAHYEAALVPHLDVLVSR